MSKTRPDIWMPMFIGDYLADTQHLTAEQHGAYLLLLFHQWKAGALPNDEPTLARIARMPDAAWSSAWKVLEKFFTHNEAGEIIQLRVERERAAWGEKKAKAVVKARHAAEIKHQKEKAEKERAASGTAPSMPQGVLESCPPPPPPPSPKETLSRQNPDFDGPRGVSSERAVKGSTEDRAAVERVFTYYLEKLDKSPKQYALTPLRMKKGLEALRECQKRFGCGLEAEEAMGAAVDGLLANKYLMGHNDQAKRYTDWEHHIFKSPEKMEARWQDGGFNPDVYA